MYKITKTIIAICVVVVAIIGGAIGFFNSASSSTTITLNGTAYKTPSGAIIDLVQVPGFGKCLITQSETICRGK